MSQNIYGAERTFRFEGITYKNFEEFKKSPVYIQIQTERDEAALKKEEEEKISERKHQDYLNYIRNRNRYSGSTFYWMHEDMRRKEMESRVLPVAKTEFKLDKNSPIYSIVCDISKELDISHEEVIANYSGEIKRRINQNYMKAVEKINNYPTIKQMIEQAMKEARVVK